MLIGCLQADSCDFYTPLSLQKLTQEFYIDSGYLNVDSATGLVKPTMKWCNYREGVSDTLSQKIITFAETGFLNRGW